MTPHREIDDRNIEAQMEESRLRLHVMLEEISEKPLPHRMRAFAEAEGLISRELDGHYELSDLRSLKFLGL